MTEKRRAAGPDTTGSAPGGSAPAKPAQGSAAERIVIRNKRKIDPSGKVKSAGRADGAATTDPEPAADSASDAAGDAAAAAAVAEDVEVEVEQAEAPVDEAAEPPVTPAPGPLGAELEALRAELDERTRDLQRVSAEYANYRKRVDRDRGVAAEQTIGVVLAALLPVLDDLDRAREHGDLVGPFATVAEQLIGAVGKFGLNAFGEKGEPFDPTRHEAVAHLTSAEVTEPTCVDVMRRGYLVGDRLLRAALVAVADPE